MIRIENDGENNVISFDEKLLIVNKSKTKEVITKYLELLEFINAAKNN